MDIPADFDAAQLFRNHPDPMWVYDLPTLGFLAVNEAAVAQYGYSQSEFREMTIADIRPQEDIALLRDSVAQQAPDHSHSGLWRHQRKSGEIIYAEIVSQNFRYGGRPARLVTARDATARTNIVAALSRAQSRLHMASWELDLERNEASWSQRVYEIFGLDPRTWPNTRENFFTLIHPEDRDRYRREQEKAIRTRGLFDIRYRARHASGSECILHEVGEVLWLSGRPVFSAVVQDITDFATISAESARLTERLRAVIEGMSDAFYLVDQEWRFSYINRNAETLLDRRGCVLTGRILWEEFPEVTGTPFECALRKARSSGITRRVTGYYAPIDRCLEVTVHPAPEGLAVYFRDVTDDMQAEVQRKLIDAAVNRLNDVVFITEAEAAPGHPRNKIIYANEAARKMTGYGPEELVGRTPKILHGPRTRGPALDRLNAALRNRGHAQEELIHYTRQGKVIWVEVNLSPIHDEAGICTHFVAIRRDITARKNTERELRLAATKDPLTGLPNRTFFTETLQRELEQVCARKGTLALLFLDIDNFKNINDSLGHNTGDELLLSVSLRLAEIVKQTNHLARFGGDEFVVIFPGADAAAAQGLAERLIEALVKPFIVGREQISITTSIGIVVAPEDGKAADELIRKADIAMYRSKAGGRNRATHFDDTLNQEVLRNAGLTQALQKALTIGDGFSLVYQPQYALEDEPKLVGAEALLRWQHPEYGAVHPGEFIPAAEQAGIIRQLDRKVIEMAARQIGAWNRQGYYTKVSVNISTNTLEWEGLADFIIEQLNTEGVPPHLFGVEIIETRLFESSRFTIGNLLELRRVGICIAIDDFGTGHSSLSYLQSLPVDVIKIDQVFVQGLDEGKSRNGALIRAILAMAHALELQVVAEGVETETQRQWLTRNRCEAIQGFLSGRPAEPEVFARVHLRSLPTV